MSTPALDNVKIATDSWTIYRPHGKTTEWSVRGVYCGVRYDRASIRKEVARVFAEHASVTDERSARSAVARLARLAKANKHPAQIAQHQPTEPERITTANVEDMTFADAAAAYCNAKLKTGGEACDAARFLYDYVSRRTGKVTRTGIVTLVGELKLNEVTQAVVDNLGAQLYPTVSPHTRYRQCQVPVAAVLGHQGVYPRFKRSKGWQGGVRQAWLTDDTTMRQIIDGCYADDRELGVLVHTKLWTAQRTGEAKKLKVRYFDLDHVNGDGAVEPRLVLPGEITKNGEPRMIVLHPEVVEPLRQHLAGKSPDAYAFDSRTAGSSRNRLHKVLKSITLANGQTLYDRLPSGCRGFHQLRHTWAMWMMNKAGCSPQDLVNGGFWRSLSSASVYAKRSMSDVAKIAKQLPGIAPQPSNVVPFVRPDAGNLQGHGERAEKTA